MAQESLIPSGRTFGIIGAGVMGRAIAKGILDAGLVLREQMWAVSRSKAKCDRATQELGIQTSQSCHGLLDSASVLLVAVKPFQIEEVCQQIREAGIPSDTLLISVLAGVTTERLQSALGTENPWIRSMPNTPSLISKGMTVICGSQQASPQHLEIAQKIFSAIGRCLVLEEKYFNAATAISGSGPAYMYLILEALTDAGVQNGLQRAVAQELATQTMLGAAEMVLQSNRHPAELRGDVTTPGGCTIAGLMKLEEGKIRSVLAQAVEEATIVVGKLGSAK